MALLEYVGVIMSTRRALKLIKGVKFLF